MWRAVLLREEQELQHEMQIHEDILLVDVVDVYRNLPTKLLKFYSWLVLLQRFGNDIFFGSLRPTSLIGNITRIGI